MTPGTAGMTSRRVYGGSPCSGRATQRPCGHLPSRVSERPPKLSAVALVTLRAPLKDLAGGQSDQRVDGATVGELMRTLEADHPRMRGWILDEQGNIRRHVNVFVNGEYGREDTPVADADRIHVLPSISGGK